MKLTQTVAAAFTLAAIIMPASAETKSITIKQSMPVGKRIEQSMTLNQKMNMAGGPNGQGMKMSNKMLMDMSMEISKLGKDQKKAVTKFEKASMNVDMGFAKQEFSSENDDGNPFTKLVGKSFDIIFDENDEVVDVKGADNLLGDPADLGPMAQMAEAFNGDQMKQNISQGMLQNVPEKELKIGDSWTFDMTFPMPNNMGDLKFDGTYTIQKFAEYEGNECAVIAMEGTLAGDGAKEIDAGGQKVSMEFKESDFEGEIYFDNKLGLPRKSDTLTKMKMNMTVAGMEMSMDMTMTQILKVTKVKDLK